MALLVRTDIDAEHEWMAPLAQVALHQFVPLPVTFFRYVQAMNKLKDDTTPKICVNLTGNSHIEDISTHLPTNNRRIIAQYINKGQPYL